MASFNKVILIGNLCADPELKQTPNGISVTSFSVAVQRQGKDAPTDFFPVVAWRNTAEFITKYFRKGNAILVCGSLQTRSWTDNSGNKRSVTEVLADEARFVEKKAADEAIFIEKKEPKVAPKGDYSRENDPYTLTSATGNYTKAQQTVFEEMTPDDDLPF